MPHDLVQQSAGTGSWQPREPVMASSEYLKSQIGVIFGQKTLSHVMNLCRGQYDFLERLPEPLILYILTFLDLEDVAQLSQVSHTFQKATPAPGAALPCVLTPEHTVREEHQEGEEEPGEICNSNKLWEHIVERSCDRVTPEMRSLADDVGWKQFFFTNKLQLQLQLRRRRKRQEEQDVFLD
uniref:F-box domain-containing protein n=1 Tax=Engystomops pustulosus TaxID=76066 RepID=A0AAV6YY70_ENGPU|nr:hypothetical protein GDO81_028341 [Engystomops pustulosus]